MNSQEWLLRIVVGGGFLLLPTLAWLQYRWLGQLSSAESERVRHHLETSVDNLAREFNGEVARLSAALGFRRFTAPRDTANSLAAHYEEWVTETAHPGLVKRILTAGEAGVEELDLNTRTIRATAWPENWPKAVPPAEGLPPFVAAQRRAAAGLALPDPVLFIPRPAGPPVRPGPPAEWIAVELDSAYIRNELIPHLVRRYIGRSGEDVFQVQLVRRTEPPSLFFDSLRSATIEPRYDAAANLFDFRFGGPARAGFGQKKGGTGKGPARPAESAWELRVRHRAGSLDAALNATRIRNLAISGAVLLLMGISMVALVAAARRARRLARLQSDFVAGVSHELRTPLAVIRSAGENLADGVAASENQVKRYGSLIRDEGRRLSHLVEQILGFARLESGGRLLDKKPIELATLLARAEEAASADLAECSARLEREVPFGLPMVEGDVTALAHSLRNLIANAARHGDRGQAVQVRARARGGRIEIDVEDHGPGIEPKEMANLFEPFFRSERSKEDGVRGLGLGLPLAMRIARAHGGNIAVATKLGQGSCFTLSLPAYHGSANGDEPDTAG